MPICCASSRTVSTESRSISFSFRISLGLKADTLTTSALAPAIASTTACLDVMSPSTISARFPRVRWAATAFRLRTRTGFCLADRLRTMCLP
jgi:hypothetical protein